MDAKARKLCKPNESSAALLLALLNAILGDREKPGTDGAAKADFGLLCSPESCHAGIPPWIPKQKHSNLAHDFYRSPKGAAGTRSVQVSK